MDSNAFIECLKTHATVDCRRVKLSLDHGFIAKSRLISVAAFRRVVTAIKMAHIHEVDADYTAPYLHMSTAEEGEADIVTDLVETFESRRVHNERFKELFLALGSIQSLDKVSFHNLIHRNGEDDSQDPWCGDIHPLEFLCQIKSLYITDLRGPRDQRRLAAAMSRLSSLTAFEMRFQGNELNFAEPIFEVLQISPSLRTVKLDHILVGLSTNQLTPGNTQLIATFLQKASSKVRVELKSFGFSDLHAFRVFCDGVRQMSIEGLDFKTHGCPDLTILAEAVCASSLKCLRVHHFPRSFERQNARGTWCTTMYYTTLANSIGNMQRLEELHLDVGFDDTQAQPAKSLILNAARQCSRLKTLRIRFCNEEVYKASNFDKVLAECVRVSLILECIDMSSSPNIEVRLCEFSKVSPALLNAVQKSYTIRDIRFSNIGRGPCSFREALFETTINIYLCLNRAGRNYVVSDPSNKSECCNVLGAVSDDLNCLYTHLRENPEWSKCCVVDEC